MNNRKKTITDTLYFTIGKSLRYDTYEISLKWKDILETDGLLPTDEFGGFFFHSEKEHGFGSMKMENELETFRIAKVKVFRERPENDDEYFKRMKVDADHQKQIEEKEKLEYLRLKAKFENQ